MTHTLILTTASSRKEARRLADVLLKKKLAACISITSDVESHYHWEGKREKAKEVMMFIKTRASHFRRVQKVIEKNHSYSVPEILCLPICAGSKNYLDWLVRETRPERKS